MDQKLYVLSGIEEALMILFPNVEIGPENTLDNFEEEVEVMVTVHFYSED